MTAPRRIVSLCPSLTETLAEIGAGERLVGATRYCVRPREVVRSLPKVGGTKTIDFEKIRELDPDLVLANAEENRVEDIETLRKNYPLHVSLPRGVEDVPPVVREIGRLVGAPDRAGELAAEIENLAAGLRAGPARPFRYAYVIWKDPWMTVSDDTYVSDLLRYAGGENVFRGGERRYPEFTPEEILALDPDVLIFPSEPFPFSERHRPAIEGAFGRRRPVEFVDGDDCCWHGARTRQGLALMKSLRGRWGSA
jgi:iron complex transport system substrate-binding protein